MHQLMNILLFCIFLGSPLTGWAQGPAVASYNENKSYDYFEIAQEHFWFHKDAQTWVVKFKADTSLSDRQATIVYWENALAQLSPDNGLMKPTYVGASVLRLKAVKELSWKDWVQLRSVVREQRGVHQVYPAMRRGEGEAYYDDRVVVAFDDSDWKKRLTKLKEKLGFEIVRTMDAQQWALLTAPAHLARDAVRLSQRLNKANSMGVRWAEPVFIRALKLADLDGGVMDVMDSGSTMSMDSGTSPAAMDAGSAAMGSEDAGASLVTDSGMPAPVTDSGTVLMTDAGNPSPGHSDAGGTEMEVDSGDSDGIWEEDTLLKDQWHLFRSENDDIPGEGHIDADLAWEIERGNANVMVGVIDTGTDMQHPDLAPNIVGGLDSIDGDDDPDAQCSSSQDGRDVDSACPEDRPFYESHGTSVSGLVASVGMNGLGTSGVCPQCSLYPVRMIGGGGYGDSLSNAMTFIGTVDAGADVINNSWGPGISRFFPLSNAEIGAFVYARENGRDGLGTLILFAAGNDTRNTNGDPYNRHADTISVAASTNLDDWAVYSNYGSTIDIAAPSRGSAVENDSYGLVTTDVLGNSGYSDNDYSMDFGGTSGAAPVASGVMGLILAANPDLTMDQARLVMMMSADQITADKVNWESVIGSDVETIFAYDDKGHSIGFGYGRVNAHAAVVLAANPPAQGGPCTDSCGDCDALDRCLDICTAQDDCVRGTICEEGLCRFRAIDPTAVGEPCNDDCEFCVTALDTEFQEVSICSVECVEDEDCPYGFDCRLLEEEGPRVCAVGNPNTGEADGLGNCYSQDIGTSVQVAGSDGENYCTDICTSDGPGQCPYGFHCATAECECSAGGRQWCWEYTCTEAPERDSNWYAPLCFPDENFGVACRSNDDCVRGEYCNASGQCAWDDREGCDICKPCFTSQDCGLQQACLGSDEDTGTPGGCVASCAADGACPGDSECREVQTQWGEFDFCLSPEGGPNGSYCDFNWNCSVACRDDVPCAEGKQCEEGICEDIPEEKIQVQSEAEGVKTQSECSCSSTHSSEEASWGLWLSLVFLLSTGIRRRL